MSDESTYTVKWSRADAEDGQILTCADLTPRLAMARLIVAIKTSGAIIVHSVEREATKGQCCSLQGLGEHYSPVQANALRHNEGDVA